MSELQKQLMAFGCGLMLLSGAIITITIAVAA